MAGGVDLSNYNSPFVHSPLKTPLNNVAQKGDSVHTFGVDVGDGPAKGSYELARDKRVAEIQQLFRPVHEAATAL